MRFSTLTAAVRRLSGAPAFSAFVTATLAIGIGATTTVYSVVHALFRQHHMTEIDEVVDLRHRRPPASAFSPEDLRYLEARQTSFTAVGTWARFRQICAAGSHREFVTGEVVGGHYFEVVGIRPLLGRTIGPLDALPGQPLTAVISERLWRQWFGEDVQVLGTRLAIGAETAEIVGVMPAAFGGSYLPNIAPTRVWIANTKPVTVIAAGGAGGLPNLHARARLRPGRSPAQATHELAAIANELDIVAPIPARSYGGPTSRVFEAVPASATRIGEGEDRAFYPAATAVLTLVGVVLLVVASNLASLANARGEERRFESALRVALGAPNSDVIWANAAEMALLALGGTVIGLLLSWLAMPALGATIAIGIVTLELTPTIDPAVLGVGTLAGFFVLGAAGLLPAWRLSRRANVHQLLTSAAGQKRGALGVAQRAVLATQVAFSVLLCAGAVACVRQLRTVTTHDTGMDISSLALAVVDFRLVDVMEPQARNIAETIASSVQSLTGVSEVAIASGFPLDVGTPLGTVTTLDRPFDRRWGGERVELMAATDSIFRVLGIPVKHGRELDSSTPSGPRVAVVSENVALQLFNRSNIVGQTILFRRQKWSGEEQRPPIAVTVVGVASDTDVTEPGNRDHGTIYLPFSQHFESEIAIIARSVGDPRPLAGALQSSVRQAHSMLVPTRVATGADILGPRRVALQVATGLTTSLAPVSLLIAMVGLYGLLAQSVAATRQDIGIRIALGASGSRIGWHLVSTILAPVASGLVVGCILVLVMYQWLRSMWVALLPDAQVHVLLAVPATLCVGVALASVVPILRATRIDPRLTLRNL